MSSSPTNTDLTHIHKPGGGGGWAFTFATLPYLRERCTLCVEF